MKYLDLISQGKEETAKEDLQFKAEDAQHAVSIALLETRKAISSAKKGLKEAQKAVPYNLQTEIDITIRIESMEKGLAIATLINKERF